MCFAPQRRALFRHLNCQKWSDHGVFCTFWLPNVLRATTACTFFDISTSKSGPNPWCFVHFDFEMCFAPQRRALFRHRNFQKWSDAEVFCTFWLPNLLRATRACTFSTSQLPKVVRTPSVFNILTSKCASRHHGVHFFDISTAKSGPTMVCFVHFDFQMCFAPQRRALFSTSQLPKVVRTPGALYILTSKCGSRHNGVHFFDIATSKSGPTLRCFVHFDFQMCFAPQRRANFHLIWPAGSAPAALASLLFDPPEPQIIGKT